MRFSRVLSAASVVALSLGSVTSYAGDVSFSIQQTALRWESDKTTTEVGSTETDETTSSVETMPNSLWISATANKMSFYLYPTDSSLPIGVGYYVMPNLEVGANISYESNKNEDADKSSSETAFGPYVTYYHEMGAVQLEAGYALSMGTQKTDDPTTTPATKVDGSGMSHTLTATVLYPIAKGFFYAGGLSLNMSSGKDSESDVKQSSTTTTIDLASFRATF